MKQNFVALCSEINNNSGLFVNYEKAMEHPLLPVPLKVHSKVRDNFRRLKAL